MNWFTSLFRGARREREIDRELQFHVEEATREHIARGLSPSEARRRALLELGGREQTAQEVRDVHVAGLLERTRANLRAGVRLMRRSPGFCAAVILTLALGIGANSAVFSAINAVLLRPLPFPHGDELMLLRNNDPTSKTPINFVAPTRLEDWNRMNSSFQAITGYYVEDVSEVSGALPEKVTRAFVAPRFLQVWGVAPAVGRDFTPEEEKFGGPDAVLISNSFWQRRFHGDPSAVGKTLRIGREQVVIVGVMPASFLFPERTVELWSAVPPDSPFAQDRRSTWYTAIGRLKPGVTLAQARADMATVQSRLGKQYPASDGKFAVQIQPLKDSQVNDVRRSLWLLFGSVTLLLLIACTNIAALLLARTTEREHEIAIRASLGASRPAIIAQLLTELFVLAVIGSALGLVVAAISARALHTMTITLPRVEEITLDWRIVVYSLACALVATFVCGLLPALRATRGGMAGALAQSSRTQVSARNPVQWVLVGVQVALAVTLLVGAGLLLRSFQELARVSPGFQISHVLTLHVSASWGETHDMKALTQRINRILDAVRAVPGVEAVATSSTLPGIPNEFKTELKIDEGPQDPSQKIVADSRFVSPEYFSVMGIPMLTGEPCEEQGDARSVVVNRSFAGRYFPGSSAMGHHLVWKTSGPPMNSEIRGISGDAREEGLNTEPMPTVYWCMTAPGPDPHYLVRTRGAPMAMAETLRRTVQQVEPGRSVFDLKPLEEHLSDNFAEDRLRTILLTLFAMTAVALACVGLYGTLSYFVSMRQREIGLRLALGAVPQHIVRRFLVQGLRVAVIGCLCGLALAGGVVRLLSGMLYGVSAFDAMTFSGVVLLVLVVAGLAALIPALRASHTDPMQVLREQ